MKKLRGELFARGVTQRAIAEYAGCSEAYISRCIRGKDIMSPNVRSKVAEYLGVDEKELFEEAS